MKLSVCMVVYHAEKTIERALESVKDVADEIILVHDGPCTDKTLDIAKKYTKKIFVQPRIGEAEPHRPFSFDKATGDWILQLDDDEYLSEDLKKHLRSILEKSEYDGFLVAFEVPYGRRILKRKGIGDTWRSCLFRKDKWIFDGTIHGSVRVEGKTGKIPFILHHRPLYNNYTWRSFKRKWLKWARLQAKQQVKQKKAPQPGFLYLLKIPFWAVFYFFYYLRGGIHNGYPGIKISFMQAAYNGAVQYYIFKERT